MARARAGSRSVGPISTSSPQRSTATRWAISATTPKSWVMNSTPVPRPRLQLGDQLQDLRLGGDVERGGRLVGDQQHGIEHQRHGDHDALALAARELVRIGGDRCARARAASPRSRMAMIFAARSPASSLVWVSQHLVDLLAAGHDRIERGHRLLEDHRHARAAQLAQRAPVGASMFSPSSRISPRGRLQRLGQQAHDGEGDHRLARARFADQADDLAGVDGEASRPSTACARSAPRGRRRRGCGLRGLVAALHRGCMVIPACSSSGRACRAGRRP